MPLPVVLEAVLQPLLQSLAAGPHIALAIIGLAFSLPPPLAAVHLLPPLVHVLTCKPLPADKVSGAPTLHMSGECARTRSRLLSWEFQLWLCCVSRTWPEPHEMAAAGEGSVRVSGAQMNAMTALEGLLPQMPPARALARRLSLPIRVVDTSVFQDCY